MLPKKSLWIDFSILLLRYPLASELKSILSFFALAKMKVFSAEPWVTIMILIKQQNASNVSTYLRLVLALGEPHRKKCHFYLGIAQMAIANTHLNLDNSSLNKCPKPSWQGSRPPPPNGQCPNRSGDIFVGASLTNLTYPTHPTHPKNPVFFF